MSRYACFLFLGVSLAAQDFPDATVTGKYHFVQLQTISSAAGHLLARTRQLTSQA